MNRKWCIPWEIHSEQVHARSSTLTFQRHKGEIRSTYGRATKTRMKDGWGIWGLSPLFLQDESAVEVTLRWMNCLKVKSASGSSEQAGLGVDDLFNGKDLDIATGRATVWRRWQFCNMYVFCFESSGCNCPCRRNPTCTKKNKKIKAWVRRCFSMIEKTSVAKRVYVLKIFKSSHLPTHHLTQPCRPPGSGYSYCNDLAFHSAKNTGVETNTRKKSCEKKKMVRAPFPFFSSNAE